jgi:membrane fusion protein, multidrug efflux system
LAATARLAAANARMRTSSNSMRDTRVVAPFSGIIDTRLVAPGEHVARGAPLFTVVRTDMLELAAAVPARAANSVAPGQVVHFTADGRRFDGKIARVAPTISPSSRTIAVYVQVPNANGALKGGTFASGRVVSRESRETLVIPTTALRQAAGTGETFVWRIAGGSLERSSVTLGIVDESEGLAEVLSGVNENDKVVIGNVGMLGPGMAVKIIDPKESAKARQRGR